MLEWLNKEKHSDRNDQSVTELGAWLINPKGSNIDKPL